MAAKDEGPEPIEPEPTDNEPLGSRCFNSCCGADLDDEDLALLSTGAGVMALALGLFGFGTWVHLLVLPLGAAAVCCGYKSLKMGDRRAKQAVTGFVCGSLALAFFLLGLAVHAVARLLGF